MESAAYGGKNVPPVHMGNGKNEIGLVNLILSMTAWHWMQNSFSLTS